MLPGMAVMGSRTDVAERLFHEALNLLPHERATFLNVACADDYSLRSEVASLLAAHDSAPAFLDTPGFALFGIGASDGSPQDGADRSQQLPEHERIGPYRLIEQIGEGGFGVVFRAQQTTPIRREVAIKVIKLGMDTREVITRFEAERQALALMDHPGIARVLDAGATKTGRPYFVMELVDGLPITRYSDDHRLTIDARLRLFESVCEAVQHAHQKGVIHRDLKPTNILVTEVDGRPQVKVIDFGIAKAMDRRLTDVSLVTRADALVGTPAYMSPEQTDDRESDFDTRSDVYSLGAVLYELLTGTTPLTVLMKMKDASHNDVKRLICERDVVRPSAYVSSEGKRAADAASRRSVAVFGLQSRLRGDLDWVVLKALARERSDRYQTALTLGRDIGNFLRDEPVLAGPPSRLNVIRKFVRRHRLAVTMSAVIAILLVGSTAVTTQLYWRAQSEVEKTNLFADFMEDTLSGVDMAVALGRDTTVLKEMLDATAERIESGELANTPEAELRLRVTLGSVYTGIADFEAAERVLKQTVAMSIRCHDEGSRIHADALIATAAWLHKVGRYNEALEMFQDALVISRRLCHRDHDDVADALSYVGSCLESLGHPASALPMLKEGLAIRRRLYPGDSLLVASDMNSVASCLDSLGRGEEALPIFEDSLAMARRLFEGDHPTVATCLNNVACCQYTLGRPGEALMRFEQVVQMRRRLMSRDHPEIADGLNNLGACLSAVGRREEALTHYREALAMSERMFSKAHPITAVNLNNVGDCLSKLGQAQEALPLLERSLAMRVELFGAKHSSLVAVYNNVARCLLALDRKEEALAQLEVALTLSRRIHGDEHKNVGLALHSSATCLYQLGRFRKALARYGEAMIVYEHVLSVGHLWIDVAKLGRGQCLVSLGRYDEAEDTLSRVWRSIGPRDDVPKSHKKSTLDALVRLYELKDAAQPRAGNAELADTYRQLRNQLR